MIEKRVAFSPILILSVFNLSLSYNPRTLNFPAKIPMEPTKEPGALKKESAGVVI